MSFKSLFYYKFHFLFNSGGVGYGFLAHDFHIVTQFDFGERDWDESELHFFLLIFFFVKALHTSQSFFFFISEMDRDHHLINCFNVFILNLFWMLDIVSDLIHEDVRLIDISSGKLFRCFSFRR